jgi:MFS family permease
MCVIFLVLYANMLAQLEAWRCLFGCHFLLACIHNIAVCYINLLSQGISFAGDFGAAVVYISELAAPSIRGRMVTTLQWSINLGLILASIVVIILQVRRGRCERECVCVCECMCVCVCFTE